MEFEFKQIEPGMKVEGTIIQLSDNEIRLDVGAAMEGTIYINEFTDEKGKSFNDLVKLGDQVTAIVKKIDEMKGQILMSRLDIIRDGQFKELVAALENDEPITVKVVRVVNKGLIVSYKLFEFFMHESQIDFEQVDLEEQVGKSFDVLISDIDKNSGKVKVSRRSLLYKKQREERDLKRKLDSEKREIEWKTFTPGSVHKGTVKEFHPFGAIIEFEANQGVLPIKEVSHHHIQSAEDELSVGDTVEVQVLEAKVKNGRNRLSLSRKALLETPYELYAKAHKVGETVTGTVVNKLPFGILVELDRNVTGLLHNSEISWNPNDNTKASLVFGDSLDLHIVSIDAKNKKIGLSKKSLEDNPWAKVTVKRDDIVKGTIAEAVVGKGFMVTVQGVEGLLPIQELREDQQGKLEDIYDIGDEIEVLVTKAFLRDWVLEFSIKRLQEKRERKQFDQYIKTQETRSVTLGDLFADVLKQKEVTTAAPKKQITSKSAPTNDLSSKTVAELKGMAKEQGLSGYTSMKKAELVAALSK